MRVEVQWHSVYRYDQPVRILHTELRVMPWSRDGQQVDGDLTVEPSAPMTTRSDVFGNTVHRFDLLGPVERQTLSLRATVQTASGITPAPVLRPLHRHLALQPTRRAPFAPEVAAFAGDAGGAPGAVASVERLLPIFRDRLEFQAGHSTVEDSALDLLASGKGVCQDFAHLALAALLMRGVPALYVSGYLAPHEGETVADASHAWVRVYEGGAWHGFDLANHCPQDERYVVTGVGRDYDDVAPLRGSYRGAAEETWGAVVRVQSQTSASQ
ncbi:MAG: hypothetical protein GEU80_01950 [Dehalococcoidia bacterium]|nr:hypothetical protein [Dehalococcoidia bacterium]